MAGACLTKVEVTFMVDGLIAAYRTMIGVILPGPGDTVILADGTITIVISRSFRYPNASTSCACDIHLREKRDGDYATYDRGDE